MPPSDKVRENKARRTAERRGLQLLKSRRRDPQALDFGGFMLTDPRSNSVVFGGEPFPYGASLDDVEAYLSPQKSKKKR